MQQFLLQKKADESFRLKQMFNLCIKYSYLILLALIFRFFIKLA